MASSNDCTGLCNNDKYTWRYENNCYENYGVIYDRSDADNPPPLPPELPPSTVIPYTYSNISNNWERILLFSLTYQMVTSILETKDSNNGDSDILNNNEDNLSAKLQLKYEDFFEDLDPLNVMIWT